MKKRSFSKKIIIIFLFPELFVSRNVGNSIKCKKKHYASPTFEITNQNQIAWSPATANVSPGRPKSVYMGQQNS